MTSPAPGLNGRGPFCVRSPQTVRRFRRSSFSAIATPLLLMRERVHSLQEIGLFLQKLDFF